MKTVKNEYVARIYLNDGRKFFIKVPKRIAVKKLPETTSATEIITYYAEKTYYNYAVPHYVDDMINNLYKVEISHYIVTETSSGDKIAETFTEVMFN